MKKPFSRSTVRRGGFGRGIGTRRVGNSGLLGSPARLATFAVLAFVLVFALGMRTVAPGAFTALATPFWRAGTALTAAVGNTVSFESRAALQAERARLSQENEALRNQNAVLAARATDLERLLGGRAAAVAEIPAAVLARPPVSPYDILVVDQGSNAGITPGAAAFGSGGIPVGTVDSVSAASARISLYSSTGRVTEGWLGEARTPVRLTGTGAGGFDAEVAPDATAAVGDTVFVSGPGALPVGTVTEVITDPSSPTVKLRVRGQANPFTLTWVTIAPSAVSVTE